MFESKSQQPPRLILPNQCCVSKVIRAMFESKSQLRQCRYTKGFRCVSKVIRAMFESKSQHTDSKGRKYDGFAAGYYENVY
jgi:hypothetical protein